MGVARTCNNGRNTVCIKIEEIGGNTTTPGMVKRMCGNYDYGQGTDMCKVTNIQTWKKSTIISIQDTRVQLVGSRYVVATLCTCDKDLCNKGSRGVETVALLGGLLMLALYL